MSPFGRTVSALLRGFSVGLVVLIVLVMLVPVILVAILSLSGDSFVHFPPSSYGLTQYRVLLSSASWTGAIQKSFTIAIPTAVLALAIGLPAVFAMHRTELPFREGLRLLGLSPLIIPGVAYAIAMYAFFAQAHLVGSIGGLILAHTILALPFVLLIAGAGITRIPRELELVAMTLGASRLRATVGITFRLLLPAIGAAFVFAFLASFDEATFVSFLAGPANKTLPLAIFNSVMLGIDPVITAIATLLMAGTGIVMMLAVYLRRDPQRV